MRVQKVSTMIYQNRIPVKASRVTNIALMLIGWKFGASILHWLGKSPRDRHGEHYLDAVILTSDISTWDFVSVINLRSTLTDATSFSTITSN